MLRHHISRILVLLLLMGSSFVVEAQTQIFKGYNFDDGGYYLLGTRGESDYHSLTDSLQQFYTDEVALLNDVKETWTFKKESPIYACGYHYRVYLCKDGNILERLSINLNCNVIATSRGYFYFEVDKLRRYAGKMRCPKRKSRDFTTVQQGREYVQEIRKDENLIMMHLPDWIHYDGELRFSYDCDNLDIPEEEAMEKIRQELAKKYPRENFQLESRGGSSIEIFVRLLCNKSMGQKFDNYKVTTRWTPFTSGMIYSWWKISK